ncbi:MAG: MFS transporter [Elusimicrobia bacterium]|nr:MFS transporter [Elusimicrobiota bacterium]
MSNLTGRHEEGVIDGRYAFYVAGVLFVVNLLNYIDRQVLYAVFPLIKPDLNLSDTQLGALASSFMLVYMCVAPFIGHAADAGAGRVSRAVYLSSGVGVWSLATVFSGLSGSYAQLLGARSLVGVGEASYGSISPSFLAEYFSPGRRGRVLAFFSMAIPVGSAVGYIAGGMLGQHFGWRAAFYIVGVPGLLIAAAAHFLKDPRLGKEPAAQIAAAPVGGTVRGNAAPGRAYAALLGNRTYVYNSLAVAAMTFALGGLATWMPSFFVRNWGMDVGKAGMLFGGVTVVAGVSGSLAGGWLGDWLLRLNSKAYLLLSGMGLILAAPFAVAALWVGNFTWAVIFIFLAEFFAFLNMGPLNAVIINVTAVSIRSIAFAVNIFAIHALGDALSPTLIGYVSDLTDLRTALSLSLAALLVAGALCFAAMRDYDEDCRRATGASGSP